MIPHLIHFASKELLSAPQIDAEKARMNEAKSVQPKDSILGTDSSSRFDDLTSLVYREMLDQVLEVQ